ncbi:MAG: N-acetylmuramoyl-L-alanine amidase, partial [Verrucomicrobiota bacterium]
MPTLRGSAYTDPDGDAHNKTWWEIKRVSDNATIWDSDWRTTDLTSTTVPSGKLAAGVAYKWRVRYMDSKGDWSENPSTQTTFTTMQSGDSGVVDYGGATWIAAGNGHFTSASRVQADVTSIVIHTTEDASYGAAISWFQDPAGDTSSHYIVQRDGSVVQMVREKDIAHHAGTTGISASWTWNQHSIGIEVERLANPTEQIANAQYNTVKSLVDSIRTRFDVPLVFPASTPRSSPTVLVNGIVGHGKPVANGVDPVNWDWAHFQQLFTGSCTYSLSPASTNPGSSSDSGSFTVTTGTSCAWSAISDATGWLHTSSSGSANGTVNYTYDLNPSPNPRTGHITVGGQTFTVTQARSSSTTRQGVDYSFSRPSPSGLKAAGYDFAIRYVSPPPNSKNITLSEAQALQSAGIDIILVFESTAGRILDGYNAGVADANTAVTVATAAGAPHNFFCYFACDIDATPSDQTAINAYLDGAASALGGVQRVGLYAGYWPLSRALDAGKAAKGWQTTAWSGGNKDSRISLYQHTYDVTIAGGTCDINDGYGADLGQWSLSPTLSQSYPLTRDLNLISFPFTPMANGSSRFSDVFAPIINNFVIPYAFYLNSQGTFEFKQFSQLDAEAKKGYFAAMKSPSTITVSGAAVDTKVTLGRDWNLIGVAQNAIPPNNPNVYRTAFSYQNENLTPIQLFQTSLTPGQGYFVYSFTDNNVLIPGAGQSSVSSFASADDDRDPIALPESAKKRGVRLQSETVDFAVIISVEQVNAANSPTLTFGIKASATDDFDTGLDAIRDIPFPGNITAFFDDGVGARLKTSFKTTGPVKEWPVYIFSQSASVTGGADNLNPVQLSWTIPSTAPSSARFELLDGNRGTVVSDMRTTVNTSFAVTGAGTEKRYIVRVSLTVPDVVQEITFNQPANKTYGDAPFALNATASSGLPVIFTVVGPATLSGNNTLTLTGAGIVTVTATQPGNAGVLPASPVDRSFTVAKAPLTARAD